MLQYIRVKKAVWYTVCVGCLWICLLGAGKEGNRVEVYVDQVGEDFVVHADGITDLSEGHVVALCLIIEAEEAIGAVVADVADMTVTTGRVSDRCVRVLIDGVPRGDTLCRVKASGQVDIQMTDNRIYIYGDTGVVTETIACRQESGESTDTALHTIDSICTGVFEPTEETTEARGEGKDTLIPEGTSCDAADEREETSEVSLEADEYEVRYIGCRESRVEDGLYAVQFLFDGREVPVICVEGGGVLTVEQTAGAWSICTFRGLRQTGKYRFYIYDSGGIICVLYENGSFRGQYRA